jgi:hypothetical protein
VATDPSTHGSISQKITNARILFTDQNDGSTHSIGTVTIPLTIPVLVTGEQEITIDPVIKDGGNSFFLTIYPFYNRFQQVIDLKPNEDLVVTPTTTYVENAVFQSIEDFEGVNHRWQGDGDNNPATFIEISDEDVFEGNASGKIHLSVEDGNAFVVASTTDVFNFDFAEIGRIYMELNYKSDVPMEFGVLAINSLGQETPIFEFAVLERQEWNKIYFNLTNIMVTSNQENFVFIMRAGIPIEEGEFTMQEADIYLDNIKVVHF